MIVLDIETVPTTAALQAPFDPTSVSPPANYKSAEAIQGFLARAEDEYKEKRVKECSINPRLGRVLCLCYKVDDEAIMAAYAQEEASEPALLAQFWALLKGDAAYPLVTWNGGFDLRYLVVRSLAYGIRPSEPVAQWFKRYSLYPHFDVKAALLQEWGAKVAGEGLDEWAQFFGIQGKSKKGSDVYPMYLDGQHEAIQQYCAQDVAATAMIYDRIKGVFA